LTITWVVVILPVSVTGPLAQLAEQQPFKLWVTGSIPVRLI
jgi:hypothetical protein